MKKILALLLALSLFVLGVTMPTATAAGSAEIGSEDFSFVPAGRYDIDEIKEDIKKLNNGDLTREELGEKYGSQLREVDINISGIKELNDIYGIQFSVKVSSSNVALAYLETNLQNSSKIGVSRWEAYMSHRDSDYKSALVLMYGTKAVTAAPNDVVNKITSDKYKIAKLYYIIDSSFADDFKITYSVEDIASKDETGTVKSISSEFKSKSSCDAKLSDEVKGITAKMLGAQVRTGGRQGIRFGTQLAKDKYLEKCDDVSYGTLIAVTNKLGDEKLTLEAECDFLDCPAKILEENDDYICFSGEVNNFPKNGDYDTVNFTARAYVKYKAPDSEEYTIVYTEPIVRSVTQIKSILGIE